MVNCKLRVNSALDVFDTMRNKYEGYLEKESHRATESERRADGKKEPWPAAKACNTGLEAGVPHKLSQK